MMNLGAKCLPDVQVRTFLQVYAGEFLTVKEVQEVSQKRSHSFSHRTCAHDVYQNIRQNDPDRCDPPALERRSHSDPDVYQNIRQNAPDRCDSPFLETAVPCRQRSPSAEPAVLFLSFSSPAVLPEISGEAKSLWYKATATLQSVRTEASAGKYTSSPGVLCDTRQVEFASAVTEMDAGQHGAKLSERESNRMRRKKERKGSKDSVKIDPRDKCLSQSSFKSFQSGASSEFQLAPPPYVYHQPPSSPYAENLPPQQQQQQPQSQKLSLAPPLQQRQQEVYHQPTLLSYAENLPPQQQQQQPQSQKLSPAPPLQQPRQQEVGTAISKDKGCTVVVRNIPRCVTQAEMYNRLVKDGFEDNVVLLYVPWLMGRSEQANLGYAFVHMETSMGREALGKAWQGKFPFGNAEGGRAINIASAAIQGAAENMAVWKQSKKMTRIRNPLFRPMVFKPTETLKW